MGRLASRSDSTQPDRRGSDLALRYSSRAQASAEAEGRAYLPHPSSDDTPPAILFVRSVALPIALDSLAALRAAYPHARITVLTNDASARAIGSSGHADEIVRYSPTRFGIVAAGPARLLSLRARRFDLVLVPYSGRSWLPFWNVGRFALALGGRETRWLPADIAPTGDPAIGKPVSISGWARAVSPGRRARMALVACLKWPTLLTATLVGLLMLALIAPLLFVFVWLTPPGDAHGA